MLDAQETGARAAAEAWLARFDEALSEGVASVTELFVEDCHWRDLVALTGELRTTSGAKMPAALVEAMALAGVRDIALAAGRLPPSRATRAGTEVIEAVFGFETPVGHCKGLVRLLADDPWQAWSIMTALDRLADDSGRVEPAYAVDVRAPNWRDQREAARAYADRDPQVLIVGGGHAGLALAARLTAMGIDTLVVDREKRVGDNWRLRYHSLKLHNQILVNEMPFLPFPATWPRYIPKDMIADWLEFYAQAMEINFWTETEFEHGDWNDEQRVWTARLKRGDGHERVMHPRHIVMACSASAVPVYPDIPTLETFAGDKIHAAHFEAGAEWQGRPVMVLGTGTSGHDLAQHLHAHGAQVTIVQRSPTMVVNVEPSAQLYDGLYMDPEGPPIEDRDFLNVSIPFAIMKRQHQILTDEVKEIDREMLDGLEKAGFRLEYGEDNTGWPLKFRTRGGGYYFNAGCSELIIAGEIDLIQYNDIAEFVADGVLMTDGTHRPVELVVMATGYQGQGALVASLFGAAVAERAGPVWGFNEKQEMCNMWTPTGQPGLWFTAGAFSQARIYGKYLALEIAMDLKGVRVGGA